MPLPKPARPFALLVSFDLNSPQPGDPRYRDVDRFLARYGVVLTPLKQLRILVTTYPVSIIATGVRLRIGPRGGASVIRIAKKSIIECNDPGMHNRIQAIIRTYGA